MLDLLHRRKVSDYINDWITLIQRLIKPRPRVSSAVTVAQSAQNASVVYDTGQSGTPARLAKNSCDAMLAKHVIYFKLIVHCC